MVRKVNLYLPAAVPAFAAASSLAIHKNCNFRQQTERIEGLSVLRTTYRREL